MPETSSSSCSLLAIVFGVLNDFLNDKEVCSLQYRKIMYTVVGQRVLWYTNL